MATATIAPALRQSSLSAFCPITAAVKAAADARIEKRGAIFTRHEVVDFILDLSGYTVDQPLHKLRLLEPSFGYGDFLLTTIDRLLAAWPSQGLPDPLASRSETICAVKLQRALLARTTASVPDWLTQDELSERATEASERLNAQH